MNRLKSSIGPLAFKELTELSMQVEWLTDYNIELETIWNLFDAKEERELIKKLLEQFVFIRSRDTKIITQQITQNVIENWNLAPLNTFFVATSDNAEADGSQALIQSLKNSFAAVSYWKENNFKNSISAIKELPNNSNIILIDDFIGSGKTATKRLKWVNEQLKESQKVKSNLYFIAMAGMIEGIENIDKNEYKDIFVAHKLKKGISDYYTSHEKDEMITLMLNMEKKLNAKYNKKNLRDFSLGYGKAESLYSVEAFSTPNNVFPLFWWSKLHNGTNWKTFFNRL